MRTHVLSCIVFGSVLMTACISPTEPGGDETTGQSQEALMRGGLTPAPAPTVIYDPPPPPDPDPDPTPDPRLPVVPIGPIKVAPPPATCDPVRFDLRRANRTCENLPGAYVEGGVTYVPGTNGRFRVGRLLAGTDAPAFIQARACSFVWQPNGCANPDTAKLLVEEGESLQERPASCLDDPGSCGVETAPITPPPSWIPNGTGRCDVCGYATSNTLWVVLPPDWSGFRFVTSGTLQYVTVPQGTEPAVVQVPLTTPVSSPQTVSIWF